MSAQQELTPVEQCDVAIIGGGPAGASAACRLIEHGYNVAVIEKAHFPRFHIGESLLPANLRLLEQLGVRDRIDGVSIRKRGVELVSEDDKPSAMLEFAGCWDKEMPYAFHVERARFDEVLLRRAQEVGAQVNEGWEVTDIDLGNERMGEPVNITAQDAANPASIRRWQARFLLDASGRDTLMANRLQLKKKNPRHSSAAMFAHFKGAQRLSGDSEGNISIFLFKHGWMWFIPLANGVTSVGAVCWPSYLKSRKGDLAEFFAQTLELAPKMADRLKNATRLNDVTATGNYSYSADRSHGNNYLLIGDAYAFVDPVFSSGVHLAMNSAFAGAQTVHECLSEPATAPAALKRFDRIMHKGPREFSWFIYRITKPIFWGILTTPRNPLRMREAVLSLLAGDIFGQTPIWPSLYAFKGVYYITCLVHLPQAIREWRQRKANIRPVNA